MSTMPEFHSGMMRHGVHGQLMGAAGMPQNNSQQGHHGQVQLGVMGGHLSSHMPPHMQGHQMQGLPQQFQQAAMPNGMPNSQTMAQLQQQRIFQQMQQQQQPGGMYMGQPRIRMPQNIMLAIQNQQMHANNPGQGMMAATNPGQAMMNPQHLTRAQALALQNHMTQQGHHPPPQMPQQPHQMPQAPPQHPQSQGHQPPQQSQQGQPQSQPQVSQASGGAGPGGGVTPMQTSGPTPATLNQSQQSQGQQPQGQQQQVPMGQQQVSQMQQQHANMLLLQRRQEQMRAFCLMRLMQFNEDLSGFADSKGHDDLSYWIHIVRRYFSQTAIFRLFVHLTDADDVNDQQFEISYPGLLARLFHTHFSSGVTNIQLILDKGTIDRPLPHDCHWIENANASMVYWYENGSHVVASGTLKAQFDPEQKIELLEFVTASHQEFVAREAVIKAAKPMYEWTKEYRRLNSLDGERSPEMSKKGKARQLKAPTNDPPAALKDLPESVVNIKWGFTEAVTQFLEIVKVLEQMGPLLRFYHGHPTMTPHTALEQYVATHIGNNSQPTMNGQSMSGPRTPGFMGASPAPTHMPLPGSPHAGSPAAGMQAPGLQPQPSQQGTGSSAPSANTSPASNKRRIKEEDVSGGPSVGMGPGGVAVNGMTGKKPATPRMTKKFKPS